MKMRFMSTTAALLMGVFLFVSCSKEGPAGPQGESGAPGTPGPAGPAGPAGAAGTANVIYSDWIDLAFDSVRNEQLGYATWFTQFTVNKLDNAMLSTGSVKVYVNLETLADPTITEVSTIGLAVLFWLNTIQLSGVVYDIGEEDPYSTLSGTSGKIYQYRYVLIPGGVKASSINWNNYAEVKEALQLKD